MRLLVRFFELMKIATMRTKLLSQFDCIIDDEMEWNESVRAPIRHRDCSPVLNPVYAPPRPVLPIASASQGEPHWRSHRWAMTFWGYIMSVLFGTYAAMVAEAGRTRLNCVFAAGVVWLATFLWARYGFVIPCTQRAQSIDAEDDDEDDDDTSEASEASTPRTPQKAQETSMLKGILDGQKALADVFPRSCPLRLRCQLRPLRLSRQSTALACRRSWLPWLALSTTFSRRGLFLTFAQRMRDDHARSPSAAELLKKLQPQRFLPHPQPPGLLESSLRASAREWAPFRDGRPTSRQAAKVL